MRLIYLQLEKLSSNINVLNDYDKHLQLEKL